MIKKILISAILIVSAVQMSVGQTTADEKTQDQVVTIDIRGLSELVFTPTTANETFIFDDLSKLAGLEQVTGTMKIRSNKPWHVKANVQWTSITSVEDNVVEEDFFQIRVPKDDGNIYHILNGEPKTILTGQRGVSEDKQINYKIAPGYNIAPGSYDITVNYTLTQE